MRKIGLPENLQGLTVLDVGAWDGFYSFEAERRGAARVVATDSYCWGGGTKDGFEVARRALHSRLGDLNIDVLDLSPEKVGTFGLVLFLGVIYHMRHPLLALERVFSVTAQQLVLETHVDLLQTNRPAAAFYPGSELNKDPTNWWAPNVAAVGAMFRTVGFRRMKVVAPPSSLGYRLGNAVYLYAKRQARLREALNQSRIVVHASRC